MKEARHILLLLLGLVISSVAHAQQFKVVIDKKAREIVEENTAAAAAAEAGNLMMYDTIMADRATWLGTKVTVHNLLMQSRQAQQNYLGNLGDQSRAYKTLLRKCERLLNASEALVGMAIKYPGRMIFIAKMANELLGGVSSDVEKLLRISMRSKARNPLEKEEGKESRQESDGANLLYYDERMNWFNSVMYEIDRVSFAMEVYTFMLQTRYDIDDYLRLVEFRSKGDAPVASLPSFDIEKDIIMSQINSIRTTIQGRPFF